MGPTATPIQYSDDLTATLTCTAFGGDGVELHFRWSSPNNAIPFNTDSHVEIANEDYSTTSIITTDPLSLAHRGEMYTCDVAYASNPSEENEVLATLNIGEIMTSAFLHR